MRREIFAIALVSVAFAMLSTSHLLVAVGLARRHPRWMAPLAFAVPPLAPFFAIRVGHHARAAAWIVSAAAYGAALYFASMVAR